LLRLINTSWLTEALWWVVEGTRGGHRDREPCSPNLAHGRPRRRWRDLPQESGRTGVLAVGADDGEDGDVLVGDGIEQPPIALRSRRESGG